MLAALAMFAARYPRLRGWGALAAGLAAMAAAIWSQHGTVRRLRAERQVQVLQEAVNKPAAAAARRAAVRGARAAERAERAGPILARALRENTAVPADAAEAWAAEIDGLRNMTEGGR